MAQRLIIISASGTPKALERLEERIGTVVEGVTSAGGVDALTTDILAGAQASRAGEILRDAAAGRVRPPPARKKSSDE
jgi:hypothetical protein